MLLLGLVYLLGVELRVHRLHEMGVDAQTPFFIESAMRYRITEYIAQGKPLPALDFQMLWPEGYPPPGDTILQEYLLGTLARVLEPAPLSTASLSDFVRSASRWIYCLIALPLFWLTYQATGKRWAALFGCLLYFTLPCSLDRSTGLVIYRENVCQPFVALHVAAFFAHFRRPLQGISPQTFWQRLFDQLSNQRYIWLSGLCLVIAHLTWKVMTFYQLWLHLFLMLLCILRLPDLKLRSSIYALTLPVLVVSLIPGFPLAGSMQADRYWGSTNAALTLALCLFCWVASRVQEGQIGETAPASPLAKMWARATLLLTLAIGTWALLPGGQSYSHAWSTLVAKVKFLGIKPDDPALLDISSRHYWTGNYRSPTVARALRDFALPALLCVMLVRRKWPSKVFLKVPTSEQTGWFLIVAGAGAYGLGYFMFRKFGTFFGLFIIPIVALAAITVLEQAKHRQWLGRSVLVGFLSVAVLASWNNMGAESTLTPDVDPELEPGEVYSTKSLDTLSRWLMQETPPKAPVLASWALSPFLHAYLDKSTVLNSYFEGPQVFKTEEFYRRLYMRLEDLHAFAQENRAEYLILEAHMLLRTDKWMSFRYVADALTLTGDEACYRLHYTPEAAPGFALLYQNDFFRVYKVLPDVSATVPVPEDLTYAPLFDPQLPGAQVGQPLDAGPALLYGLIEAGRRVTLGDAQLQAGMPGEALRTWTEALEKSPYLPDTYLRLMTLAQAQGRQDQVEKLRKVVLERFGGQVTP